MDLITHPPHKPHKTVASSRHRRQRRLSINITPVERGGRIAIGLAATIAGVVLFVSASSALAVILEVLLIAAGLDLFITGARTLPALSTPGPHAIITRGRQ